MIIYQNWEHKADEFTISNITSQELANIIECIEACNWKRTPWGKSIITRFNNAISSVKEHMKNRW